MYKTILLLCCAALIAGCQPRYNEDGTVERISRNRKSSKDRYYDGYYSSEPK